MDASKQLVFINGKDKTSDIVSCQFHGRKCDVVYSSSPKVYSYHERNVDIFKLQRVINPATVIFRCNGEVIEDATQIRDYGAHYLVYRKGKKELTCRQEDVQISENCLSNIENKSLFNYFKETAASLSLITENGINILSSQYDKITAVENNTILARYLNASTPIETTPPFLPSYLSFWIKPKSKESCGKCFQFANQYYRRSSRNR